MKTKSQEFPNTVAELEKLIAEQQEIQKHNPFGSKKHRIAHEIIRTLVLNNYGKDIGSYE